MKEVKLIPNDYNNGIMVPIEVAMKFRVYKDAAEMYEDKNSYLSELNLDNVSLYSLKKAIEFAQYHLNNPDVIPPNTDEAFIDWDNLSPWDKTEFCNELTKAKEWIPLVNCANYLGYDEMIHVTCKRLGFIIGDFTIEEIKQTFST